MNETITIELCGGPLDGKILTVLQGIPQIELYLDEEPSLMIENDQSSIVPIRPPTIIYRPQLFFNRYIIRKETGAQLWEIQ